MSDLDDKPVFGKWQPIKTAPRGYWRDVPAGKIGTRSVFVEQWIWGWRRKDGHMTPTCWLAKEPNGEGGRWNAYGRGDGPDMWHVYKPEPPETGE